MIFLKHVSRKKHIFFICTWFFTAGFFLSNFVAWGISICGARTSIQNVNKGIPKYRPCRPTEDMAARIHMFAATALRRGRLSSPILSLFYVLEGPGAHFTRGWMGSRASVKMELKNLHPSGAILQLSALPPEPHRPHRKHRYRNIKASQ